MLSVDFAEAGAAIAGAVAFFRPIDDGAEAAGGVGVFEGAVADGVVAPGQRLVWGFISRVALGQTQIPVS